jgi:glucosyl-3-phosphoglycerate synthase
LVRALINVLGPNDYLGYLDSFRYALSGEFSMQTDVINTLRIPGDWGLEVGVLSEIYRNYSKQQICQVDIADHYDHKHQPLSEDDASTGLLRMSNDIAKSIYRKLATQGVTFSMELFRTIKATYFRTALDLIEQYHCEAQMNGLTYERHAEERAVEVFVQSIINAGQGFLANPTEAPFIPNWNRVASAIPEFGERLLEAVEFDNRY